MSDSSVDPVSQANALVEAYQAIVSPTTDDVNTLTVGFSSILSEPDITTDEITQVLTILSSTIETTPTLSAEFSFDSLKTTTQWFSDTTSKFLTAFLTIFTDTPTLSASSVTKAKNSISSYQSSQTVFQDDSYTLLIGEIKNELLPDEYNSISNLCSATYTMYKNLNTSNYLSIMCSYDELSSSLTPIGAYIVPIIISSKMDITPLLTALPNILTGNAADISKGMSRIEFIKACEDMLALLSPYLTTDPTKDNMTPLKTIMDGLISSNFSSSYKNSTSFSTSMNLSGAETLTSTVSTYFGVGAIPLTPKVSASFISQLPTVYALYPFNDGQNRYLQNVINNYFISISYPTYGLSATQVGAIWPMLKAALTGPNMVVATSEQTVDQWLAMFQTSFNNLLIIVLNSNITNVLNAYGYFDSWSVAIETVTNPIKGTSGAGGIYLSDWLSAFIGKITPVIGDVCANILNLAVTDMMKANNNIIHGAGELILGYSVTGSNFIQIGIEILLFLINFMEQIDLDVVAGDFSNFLVTILYAETTIEAEAAIANEILIQIAIFIVLTAATLGIGAAFSSLGAATAAVGDGITAVTDSVEGATTAINTAASAVTKTIPAFTSTFWAAGGEIGVENLTGDTAVSAFFGANRTFSAAIDVLNAVNSTAEFTISTGTTFLATPLSETTLSEATSAIDAYIITYTGSSFNVVKDAVSVVESLGTAVRSLATALATAVAIAPTVQAVIGILSFIDIASLAASIYGMYEEGLGIPSDS